MVDPSGRRLGLAQGAPAMLKVLFQTLYGKVQLRAAAASLAVAIARVGLRAVCFRRPLHVRQTPLASSTAWGCGQSRRAADYWLAEGLS